MTTMNEMNGIGQLIVRTIFDVAMILMLLRLLLQLFRADFYNPLAQSVVGATRFLDPLRKILGAHGGLDIATLLALIALQMAQTAILSMMVHGSVPGIALLLAGSGVTLLDMVATFFFYAIIVAIVISWIAPDGQNPFAQMLWALTEPILAPARRLLPPMGGIDFSPILVMLALMIIRSSAIPALAALVYRLLP